MSITNWLGWFLRYFDRALEASSETLASVLRKASSWEKHSTDIGEGAGSTSYILV